MTWRGDQSLGCQDQVIGKVVSYQNWVGGWAVKMRIYYICCVSTIWRLDQTSHIVLRAFSTFVTPSCRSLNVLGICIWIILLAGSSTPSGAFSVFSRDRQFRSSHYSLLTSFTFSTAAQQLSALLWCSFIWVSELLRTKIHRYIPQAIRTKNQSIL